ncbi:MAG: NAD(FAD)-dependent dehydrogenase [Variovorax sp.]|nr:MAG: NAD(FAD)-dependent dehydrogenase [Variovorax sp.]
MKIDNPEPRRSTNSAAREPGIVIAGAGHSAGRAAEALRGAGFEGRLILVGEEEWLPYERPHLSKDLLAGKANLDTLYVRPAAWYEEQGIEMVLGTRIESIDRRAAQLRLANGESIAYDRLLLATGARPRPLAVEGADLPGVQSIRNIGDTFALRKRLQPGARLLIVGAGFIGLEVAAIARERGCAVTVLEAGPHPLGRVAPSSVGHFFAELHRTHGVDLRLNSAITHIGRIGSREQLVAFASDGFEWQGDVIVAGIGSLPNVELAADAGLAVDNGIRTDAWGRTEDAAIYAAGDATSHFNPLLGRHVRLETWQNAQNQAIAVAKVMAGGDVPYSEVPWFWTDQYGVNFQSAGAQLAWDQVVWRGAPDSRQCSAFYLQDGTVVGGATINQGRQMRVLKQMIARAAKVDADLLQDASVPLEKLLLATA